MIVARYLSEKLINNKKRRLNQMKPEFILMLTYNDETVKDALKIFRECKDTPVTGRDEGACTGNERCGKDNLP
jgi:hypothetical protein